MHTHRDTVRRRRRRQLRGPSVRLGAVVQTGWRRRGWHGCARGRGESVARNQETGEIITYGEHTHLPLSAGGVGASSRRTCHHFSEARSASHGRRKENGYGPNVIWFGDKPEFPFQAAGFLTGALPKEEGGREEAHHERKWAEGGLMSVRRVRQAPEPSGGSAGEDDAGFLPRKRPLGTGAGPSAGHVILWDSWPVPIRPLRNPLPACACVERSAKTCKSRTTTL